MLRCLEVAYTVAESPLVKTALFAGDANWGRFCMAIGRAQVADLDASKVALWLDDVQVAEGGLMSSSYTEAAGSAVLAQDEFKVTIDLGRGKPIRRFGRLICLTNMCVQTPSIDPRSNLIKLRRFLAGYSVLFAGPGA